MLLFLEPPATNLFPRSSALPGRRGIGDQPRSPAPVEMLLPRPAARAAGAGDDGCDGGGVLAPLPHPPDEGKEAGTRKFSKKESMAATGSFVESAAVSACEAGGG